MHVEAEEGYTMTSPAIETLRGWGFTLDDATGLCVGVERVDIR